MNDRFVKSEKASAKGTLMQFYNTTVQGMPE
jgi:hypothetical protein